MNEDPTNEANRASAEDARRARLDQFAFWMANVARAAFGTFSLMAAYSLIADVPAVTSAWTYTMWALNGIGLVAVGLWMVTYRGQP